MKTETAQLFRDPRLLQIKQMHMQRLQDMFDHPLRGEVFLMNGYSHFWNAPGYAYDEPEKWINDALDELALHGENLDDTKIFRPISIEFGPYLVRYVDKIFGARPFYSPDTNIWDARSLDLEPGELPVPDLEKSEPVQLAKRMMKEFVALDVPVANFSLPTLSGPLNTGFNLYGSRFFEYLLTEEDAIRRDLRLITDVIVELHSMFRDIMQGSGIQMVLPQERFQPLGYSQVCGCSTQLISGGLYNDMFMDLDQEILKVHGKGGMIHICGSSVQQVENFRSMSWLKAVQVNDRGLLDLPVYDEKLRDDQILYAVPNRQNSVEDIKKLISRHSVVMYDLTK